VVARVRTLILLIGIFYFSMLWASPIQEVQNLATESQQAISKDKVYLLYISRLACPYCARLEKNVLHPMLNNGDYDAQVELRELSWEGGEVIGFDGEAHQSLEIINRYAVVGTPTLLFLGSSGEELTQRLVGYHSEDFYWYYFDEAIEKAKNKLLDQP
jgi:thioredoxin-related protein